MPDGPNSMLTPADLAAIDRHVTHYRLWFAERDLRAVRSSDLRTFTQRRLQLGWRENDYVNPAFHPRTSIVPPGTGFWLAIATNDGTEIACVATRYFDDASLTGLFRTRRIWDQARAARERPAPVETDWAPIADEAVGRLATHGGLTVDRAWTGRGIGTRLVRLIRAMSLREWGQDWNFGSVADALFERSFQIRRYGYRRTFDSFTVKPDWGPRHDREYISLISRTEMIEEYAGDPLEVERMFDRAPKAL